MPASQISPPAPAAVRARVVNDTLQLIAEGVTDIAGFGVAAIRVVRGEEMEMVAVAGVGEEREEILGTRMPLARILGEISVADDWGVLKFVPYGRTSEDNLDQWGYIPGYQPVEGNDAWHPHDLLCAPLLDGDGNIRGLLSMDMPVTGRRPGPEQRLLLEKYAEQAGRALLTALEREELAEQVRLADAARTVVRQALGQRSLDRILATCQPALVDGFRAAGMWIQTFDEDGLGTGAIHANDGTDVVLPEHLVMLAESAARELWRTQEVTIVSRDAGVLGLDDDQAEQVFAFLTGIEVASAIFVPIGAGHECLGNLVLTRGEHGRTWTEIETAAALEIGRDLGGAILNVRAFEREHRLVKELQALDGYKSELIATVSHELKNPLTSITGHLEILESVEGLPGPVLTSLSAMDRAARRLGKVVDDLLLLSKVGNPETPIIPRPVDLRALVVDAVDLTSLAAERRNLRVLLNMPAEPVMALGDADELDRVLANLVSNAVKYTPEGRAVKVSLVSHGAEVEIVCSDQGIGISAADQERLFTEFFRSTNPVAVAQPGTGLGLAIVRRIVDRHGGRIKVESVLGKGSTFRVHLPAACLSRVPGSR